MRDKYAFLTQQRQDVIYRDVKERRNDFFEVAQLQNPAVIMQQAERCMDCGTPYCNSIGCSLENLIPEWNDLVSQGLWREAYERLELTSNFPEFTGRICPAPCESACTVAIHSAAVTIKQVELAIIEHAFQENWVEPCKASRKTGHRIAVVGSGPAGLAAAQQLCRQGHDVTLFERAAKLGGLLRYGVPDFKLEKRIIDRRLQQMIEEGLHIRCGVEVGKDYPITDLQRDYDAVLLAIGALQPRKLSIPGVELKGVHDAMDYLTQSNQRVANEQVLQECIHARNKKVLVIGAGDTASDCIGTANREGAKSVLQLYYRQQPNLWQLPHNPEWPDYPQFILQESSSHKEGCEREWDVATNAFLSNDKGEVRALKCQRVRWEYENEQQRMVSQPGSDFQIEADLVLLAIGFLGPEEQLIKQFPLDKDKRGNIAQHRYATSAKGVFTAGDAHTGASLVVHAMHHGRNAAVQIEHYLQKYENTE